MAAQGVRAETAESGLRFEISFPASVHEGPITGRLFLLISRRNEPEVRLQSMWFNSPEIVAVNVTQLAPGQKAVIDRRALGTPIASLKDLQPGDYYVQAVLNVYTEFRRADGRTVWAHMDQWEGQQFNTSPGNPVSPVRTLHLDPAKPETISIALSGVIPELPALVDTQWIKHIKIESPLLSRFWGRPIYFGAVVLLPRDYDERSAERYPVLYRPAGHFTLAAPMEFGADQDFTHAWQSADFPRMVVVSVLDPTPLSDWSGGVNSVNNGPYGDAIVQELIPYIEEHFRIVRSPHARVLSGNASGGREALALQLHHPEFFGGAWIFQPWPFNFRHYSALNIYESDNAFQVPPKDLPSWARGATDWLTLERYIGRIADGTPFVTFRQLSRHDAVMDGMAAGDPIGADDAIVGPVGANGYPKPLWDRATGKVDREVANYWREHGDLALYAERNWDAIGASLVGKLHFYVGDMDHFYRNYGVHLFEEFLKTTKTPPANATFSYAPLKGDWQPMSNADLIRIMADHIAKNAPKSADHFWMGH